MKLTLSSASFATAFAFSASLRAYSNSAVASSVDGAYKSQTVQADLQECSFASSELHEVDAGILSCEDNFICVEDDHSSFGGRCVPVDMQRDLSTTCTTKCTGTDACKNVDQSIKDTIPDGSCCGTQACYGINSESSRLVL